MELEMAYGSGFSGWLLANTVESVNAAWTVLDLCLLAYLGYYLWTLRKKFKLSWRTLYNWSTGLPIYAQAAIAIFIFHLGDVGVRGIVWWVRHRVNVGQPPSFEFVAPATLVLAVFAVIAGIGLMCKLRVFSTPWLGRWVWIGGTTLALGAAVLTHFIP